MAGRGLVRGHRYPFEAKDKDKGKDKDKDKDKGKGKAKIQPRREVIVTLS